MNKIIKLGKLKRVQTSYNITENVLKRGQGFNLLESITSQ